MRRNKRLIVGKLYSLNDYFFVYNNPQRYSSVGENQLDKDDVFMVLEYTNTGVNDIEDGYRILTPHNGVMYASYMLNDRVKKVNN